MLITARWLLTGATPPLKDGALRIEGDTILEIGTRRWFAEKDVAKVVDLGETILIPGLVNAHCHLEFSALKETLPRGRPFTEWVKELGGEMQALSPTEKKEGIESGIQELIRGGTTTLVDHRAPETGSIETPFREFIFLEVIGANEVRAREKLRTARQWLLKNEDPEALYQITPHSLYAVHEEVLCEILSSHSADSPLSIHLLESEDEEKFFRGQSGPLAIYIQERGGDLTFPISSPVKWLENLLGPRLLIVHGNYLSGEEIQLLRGPGTSVIHCPGSHRFFGHRPFPLEELVRAAIPVALGTDSLASNDSLNMLREMRWMKEEFPGWGEEEILRMATLNGARAMGWDREIGTLEIGKKADLVGVPLLKNDVDPYEALLLAEEANFVMVGGNTVKNQ